MSEQEQEDWLATFNDRGQWRHAAVRGKRAFVRAILYLTTIILPRQARDKHKETLLTEAFCAGADRVQREARCCVHCKDG
jgi:hypothetical protein